MLGHNYIGTEHLLLGLLREEEGLGARVLDSLDVTLEEVRAQVARIVGSGEEVATGQIPFTPRAKKVLELSLREALSLGHNYIGTEHVLLGLVHENNGVAARILLDFGADSELVQEATIDMLEGRGTATAEWRRRREEREAEAAAKKPDLAARLARARDEKERALADHDFERAARLQASEAALRRALLGMPEPPPQRSREWIRAAPRRRSILTYAPASRPTSDVALLVAGALIFAVALAVGVLLGWLIWH